MLVLSFDPGGTTAGINKAAATGWCYQDERKTYAMGGLFSTADLHKFLKNFDLKKLPVDVVVIEEYIPLPNQKGAKANLGKRMITSEAIGSITIWASMNGIIVVMQSARLKPAQAKMTGVDPKKGRKDVSHGLDAFNHGRYYLIQQGLARTALEVEMGI